jgi:type VI secretion system secreted protein VgrG
LQAPGAAGLLGAPEGTMADLFTLSSSALPDDVRLVSFRLQEALSQPFELTVYFSAGSSNDVDLADAIGAKATVTMAPRSASAPETTWHGLIAQLDLIHQPDKSGLFRAVLVPALWFLGASQHSRIFTKLSFDEVTKKILEDAGLSGSDYELRLKGSLAQEEHICQYRESDLDFLHRWFEREGLFYFFEHGDDGAKMVIVDESPSDSLRDAPVRYFPTLGYDALSGEAFQRFRAKRRATPSVVKLRDYDYQKPSLDVKGKADASTSGQAEVSRFGERFFTPDDGNRLARVRADALLAREEVYELSGTASRLRTGYVFELEEHAREAFNKKYLATRIEHLGVERSMLVEGYAELCELDSDEVYRVEVTAIDAQTKYRAEHRTPWPRVASEELAVVDGEADSDYAQLDADGRYLVRFMFDENQPDDGKGSTRVRMMQPHGGNPEGFHFPLRKGTEVVITFLGGDPDRPVIAGVVPNAHNPSPVTSQNHTQNVVMTGGKNRIEMEDQDGKQYIDIFTPPEHTEIHMGAPKKFSKVGKSQADVQANLGEHTDGTAVFTIGGDMRIDVGGELEEHVKGNVTEDYDSEVKETYTGPKTEKVTNQVTEQYASGHKTTVTGLRDVTITGHMTETITAGLEQTVSAGFQRTVNGSTSLTFNGDLTSTGPSHTETFGMQESHFGAWTSSSQMTHLSVGQFILDGGPFMWTSGPTIWSTPSITLSCPSFTNTNADWSNSGVKTGAFYLFNIQASGVLAFAYATVNIQITPMNVAIKGMYIENKGFNLANKVFQLGGGGVECRAKGLVTFV